MFQRMKAWRLNQITDLNANQSPLTLAELPVPVPDKNEILIRISCCGVCHTELDEIEGRVMAPAYPVVPGHQVIGRVEKLGESANLFKIGDRVGVAWIGWACGQCQQCKSGNENLCEQFKATGRDLHGGYAEYMTIDERFAFAIPEIFSNEEAAPLLCAGAIGYRSLMLTGMQNKDALGLMGFGASAHIVLKLCKYLYPESPVVVFARSKEEQSFAISLGASWAGNVGDKPPLAPRAIIDTTPSWKAIVTSLQTLQPAGRLVINAIRKESSDKDYLMSLNYQQHLWMEKEIKSVANITRHDVTMFLKIASEIPLIPETQTYSFADANKALLDLKHKHVKGGKVISL
jgi:propanol-preferring alcohol dehydrogenase